VLEHRVHGVTATREVFETSLRDGQFTGIVWPGDLRPGVRVTVVWHAGKDEIVAHTTPLDEPVLIDGVDYFHEYDPKVVTREFEPGTSNWSKVLHAICKNGSVFDDGSAVFAEAKVAAKAGLGRGAKGAFLLKNAVDQLLREGWITRVTGSGDSSFPAVEGAAAVPMLFYAPLVDPTAPPEGSDRRDHWVSGFVRKLPPGAQPSEKQVSLYQRAVETEQIDATPLAPGYTFVKKHHRHN
jgi:hypothetical protein